jgi:hypothetical protein
MPLLRSRSAVRRARWIFLKVFFLAMGLLAVVYVLAVLVRVVAE